MACGHHLTHYTAKCPPQDAAKCSRNNMKKHSNKDTCSDCDPEVQKKMLHAAYDQHRSQVVHQYREAAKAGDEKTMRELEWDNMMNTNKLKTKNFKLGFSSTDADVQWP